MRMQWNKKMGCYMSFWPAPQLPAELKLQINQNYCVTLKNGESCTGVFEGYVYKMANLTSPVHVYLMFEFGGDHVVLPEKDVEKVNE